MIDEKVVKKVNEMIDEKVVKKVDELMAEIKKTTEQNGQKVWFKLIQLKFINNN